MEGCRQNPGAGGGQRQIINIANSGSVQPLKLCPISANRYSEMKLPSWSAAERAGISQPLIRADMKFPICEVKGCCTSIHPIIFSVIADEG